MAANIEIKARITDPVRLCEAAQRLAGPPAAVLVQEDVFFHSPRGRLKLRIEGDRGRLIAYDRPDTPGPRRCDYHIHEVAEPAALRAALEAALGVRGVVRKRRTLYLAGRTRIHVDHVDGLGDFLELEVVLAPGEPDAAGHAEADSLLRALGLADVPLIDRAYVDLLGL